MYISVRMGTDVFRPETVVGGDAVAALPDVDGTPGISGGVPTEALEVAHQHQNDLAAFLVEWKSHERHDRHPDVSLD